MMPERENAPLMTRVLHDRQNRPGKIGCRKDRHRIRARRHEMLLLAQKSWDKGTLYGNVGFWWRTAAETRNYIYAGMVLEREINERLELGVELFGNSPKERRASSDFAFNIGGTWKLSAHLNLLFAGGRDIVGDTTAMAYIGLQLLTK